MELASRSLIVRLPLRLALALGLAAGGCDKANPPQGQASAGAGAPAAPPPAATTPGFDGEPGATDRGHKGLALPALPFEAPGGGPATFGPLRGKPLLVNLWATWCAPCIKELPTLDALAKGALPMMAISEDGGGAAQVGPFWKAKGYATLKPYTDQHMRLMTALQVDTLPTTILFDARGKEVWRVVGGKDWTGPDAAKLLAEAR